MKTFMLSLLFLSLPVLAKSDFPTGLFQVDSSHSLATQSGEHQALSGFIDVKEEFPASRFVLETEEGLFESSLVSGDLAAFEVTGTVTTREKVKEVKLRGKFLGSFDQDETVEKIAMRLESDDCVTSVFAAKPRQSTTEMFNTVREIVR